MTDLILHWLLPCVYAFFACIGFCFLFNIHGPGMAICGFGGAVGWLVYLSAALFTPHDILRYLIAAIAITLYAELTFGIAGALALGAVLGSSLFRLLSPSTYRSHK